MKSQMNVRQAIRHWIERGGKILNPRLVEGTHPMETRLTFSNPFKGELYRGGKLIHVAHGMNDVTIVGKNYIMDCMFGKGTPVSQVDPWYIGLINQSPVPTLAEADTMDSHSGWSEFTGYSGNRVAWDDADSASKVKGSDSTSDFTINVSSAEVHGIFVCSAATGSTSSVILWATGSFQSSVPVVNTDVLKVTYGVRM